jgi:hypothetical protein
MENADIISSLIELNREADADGKIHMVISGATEAHLVAQELQVAAITRFKCHMLRYDLLELLRTLASLSTRGRCHNYGTCFDCGLPTTLVTTPFH